MPRKKERINCSTKKSEGLQCKDKNCSCIKQNFNLFREGVQQIPGLQVRSEFRTEQKFEQI